MNVGDDCGERGHFAPRRRTARIEIAQSLGTDAVENRTSGRRELKKSRGGPHLPVAGSCHIMLLSGAPRRPVNRRFIFWRAVTASIWDLFFPEKQAFNVARFVDLSPRLAIPCRARGAERTT